MENTASLNFSLVFNKKISNQCCTKCDYVLISLLCARKTNDRGRWTNVEDSGGTRYFLVTSDAMPPVLLGVLHAKELLETGKASTVGKAVEEAGISRSAFYKYRDSVSPFLESGSSRIITFHILLRNQPGVLSETLLIFTKYGANILTINQSVPVNGRAVVTISAETKNMTSIQELLTAVDDNRGVISIEAIAG